MCGRGCTRRCMRANSGRRAVCKETIPGLLRRPSVSGSGGVGDPRERSFGIGSEPTPKEGSAWRRRIAVRIDNTANSHPLSGYPVKVLLDATNFPFAEAQPDGRDLRFFEGDGAAPMPHWIERYDSRQKEAVVWVRVSHAPAAGSTTIVLRFGNPAAASASNGEGVFEFFDDCETGAAADQWEVVSGSPGLEYARHADHFGAPGGIWHASGCQRRVSPTAKTVYGGAHATYCAWTRPMAVYAPSQDKTFFVFGNAENSPTVCCYDHKTRTFANAVVVGANLDMDAHRNPHLLIDEAGYLYVFYGAHCSPAYLVKSARPFDISEWLPMGVVAEQASYPQPWQLKPGEISVLFRQGGTHDAGEARVVSRDGGRTWSQPQLIACSPPKNGFYAVSIAETGPYPRKVHLAWSVTRGDWWQRYHVYYACSEDGGATWRRSDGTTYETPIAEDRSQMVFRSDEPDRGVWLTDMQLDSSGNPYVLFVDGQTLTYQCVWRLATLRRGKWGVHEIAACDHMYDGGSLLSLADDELRAYLPTTPAQSYLDGGDMDEWRSADGGVTWRKWKSLTSGSHYSHNHAKTVFNQQRGDFQVFWNYGDAQFPPETRQVDLYFYGDDLPAPQKMNLSYASSSLPGRFLMITQPEMIDSVVAAKGLMADNVAVDAKARRGPPSPIHAMLCLRIGRGPSLYSAGVPRGKGKLYKHLGRWTDLLEGKAAASRAAWMDWSFRAFGDRLQFVVDGEVLAETTDRELPRGAVGARVWSTSLYLDDIRVRKYVTPEPSATLMGPVAEKAP